MYSYETDEMPLWSASEMFAMGLIDEATAAQASEPWSKPIDAPDVQDGAYFSDADLEPVELAA